MVYIKVPKALSVKTVYFRKNIATIGILLTGLLSIILTLLTYYGSYSGNFIVTMDQTDYERGIVLSDNVDFTDSSPRLFADSVGGATDMAYGWLKLDKVVSTDGNYVDPDYKYLAYTFYLKNNGQEAVDVKVTYSIIELYRNVDSAIRVLVIEDSITEKVYQKPDTVDVTYSPDTPKTIPFLTDSIIFQDVIKDFTPNEVKKYSVVVYIEGQDPDCLDSIYGANIKMQMKFDIIDPQV